LQRHRRVVAARRDSILRRAPWNRRAWPKAANLRWLGEGFEYAKRVHAKGVMIIWQADLNFNNEEHLTNPHDSHYVEMDNPNLFVFEPRIVSANTQ
jgi:hypothetical protein